MNRKKLRTALIIVLVLMLTVAIILPTYTRHREREINLNTLRGGSARVKEQVRIAADEVIAKREAEDAEIAAHVYSHRGSAGPEEHSFKAYDAAIEAGSRYIEQDIVVSSDGILYVSHDLDAYYMTGYDGLYEYMNSNIIDGLRTKAGNKVLRLSEVFDRYGRDIHYVIELKQGDEACINAFEKIVDEYGLSDLITIQSMSPEVLKELEQKYPDMSKLFVCRTQQEFDRALDKPYIDIISVKAAAGLMNDSNCEKVHDHDKLFSAWILDSEEMIRKAIDMGVDTYFTNNTQLALSLEREYGLKEGKRRGKE